MRCSIRPFDINDSAELAEVLNNKKVLDNLRDGLPFPYTEADAKEYIRFVQNTAKDNAYVFAIIADNRVVGNIGAFRQTNIHSKTAELGYCLAEPYWNQGVMTDAVKQFCNLLFANTDIIRLFAEPFAENIGSCRVLEKNGFVCEGTLRQNAVKNGKVLDMKMYAKIR